MQARRALYSAIAAVVGCASLVPCNFGVSGEIAGLKAEQLNGSNQLFSVVGNALKPFGFKGGQIANQGLFYFDVGEKEMFPPHRISVVVDPNLRRVSLRDYKEQKESPFVAEVLNAVKQSVADAYGATIIFKDYTGCLLSGSSK